MTEDQLDRINSCERHRGEEACVVASYWIRATTEECTRVRRAYPRLASALDRLAKANTELGEARRVGLGAISQDTKPKKEPIYDYEWFDPSECVPDRGRRVVLHYAAWRSVKHCAGRNDIRDVFDHVARNHVAGNGGWVTGAGSVLPTPDRWRYA